MPQTGARGAAGSISDYAASAPAMAGVWAAVEEFMPWCQQRAPRQRLASRTWRRRPTRAREAAVAGGVGARATALSCSCATTRRGHQRALGRAARGHARLWSPAPAPRQHAAVAPPRPGLLPVRRSVDELWGDRASALRRRGRGSTWSRSRARRTSPARSGRSPARRDRAPLRRGALRRCGSARARIARSTWRSRGSTCLALSGTSSTRRSAPAR